MGRMVKFIVSALLSLGVCISPALAAEEGSSKHLPAIPLSLDEVLAWVDRSHPLLMGAGTEKIVARGRLMRALGAFEPSLVNDTEMERFISSTDPSQRVQTGGFNDTFVDMRHPSGARALAGIRKSIGSAKIPDLAFGPDDQMQLLLGGSIPLLRGLMINAENAELQRSELADPRADVQIAQTRQDLFLGAAHQYWDWVMAWKIAEVSRRAYKVAEERQKQIDQRAKAGAVAPLDAVEASQEVQRRREAFIAATRFVEQEQYKLSMFLWERGEPVVPGAGRVPEFPKQAEVPPRETVQADKVSAKAVRPEIRAVDIEAKMNNIDLELAKNSLLPSLDASAEPARNPEKFVLGLGYKFGLEFRMPFLQRRAKGEVLEAQGKADRLVLTQRFREQQVIVDVDNAISAMERARERTAAALQSLQLAKTLEDGERFRLTMGATSVLFVNLRERNAVDSENQWIRAQADFQKALALYQWSIGAWSKSTNPTATVPVNYRLTP